MYLTLFEALNSSAVYENARQLDTDGLKQELFCEENWNSYKNISDFSIIYDGKEIYDTDNGTSGKIGTIRLYSSTIAPENSGNYVAYLAILKNPNDITSESIIAKSEGMPFYVAGYSFSRCEVLEYGENEIALFTKPSYVDGVYYVGTQSELLWCVYNQTADMNITLTNDIVVNPITVTENGNISSGALVIYKWYGFGSASSPFSGTIEGNGHTIYGVYMPESLHGGTFGLEVLGDTGFICYGKNATVRNLSIESSYFNSSSSAGAFFGTLEVTDVARIETCRSVYNLVTSDRQAGGFIGWVTSNSSVSDSAYYLVHGCINYSYVTGNVAAGGIIGKTSPTESALTCFGSIYYCFNYGKITANDFAAGIVGSVTAWHHIGYNISYCLNAGTIKATSYESGIIGELNTNGNGGTLKKECVEIWHNVNIGGLNSGCKNAYDIIAKTGNNDYYEIGLLKLDDNYYSKTKSAYPTDLTGAPTATKLTANDVKDGTVCELLMGHIEDAVDEFVSDAPQFDDITMLSLKYAGAMRHKKVIKVPAKIQSVDKVKNFVRDELIAAGCDNKVFRHIILAIDEILTNIISYSYPDGEGDATVYFSLENGIITLIFEDNGIPFNPLENSDPDITLRADEREIGGFGLFIVKKVMDRVSYEYNDGKNILTLTKII